MTHTVALASRASSGTQNKGTRWEPCRTFHQFPCYFTGSGRSCSKFTTKHQILFLGSQRHVPVRHSTTSGRLWKMACAILQARSGRSASTIWKHPQDGEQSLVSSRPYTKALFSRLFISLIRHRLSSPSSGPLGAQTPLARCTARIHGRHRERQVLRSFGCFGKP